MESEKIIIFRKRELYRPTFRQNYFGKEKIKIEDIRL